MLGYGWWQYIVILPVGVVVLIWLTEWLPKELYIQTLKKLNEISEKEDAAFEVKRREWKETHPSFEKRINFIKELK